MDMKKILLTILLGLLLSSQHAIADQASFASERSRINAARDSGAITALEAERETLSAAKYHFPSDYPMHEMISSLITYAELLQDGVLSEEQYRKKRSDRIDRYNASVAERNSAIDRERAEQESQERQRNFTRALGAGVNGMQRSLDQRKPSCTSIVTGNVISSQCY